jgi:predicted MPP superfamily phosphohydrolase
MARTDPLSALRHGQALKAGLCRSLRRVGIGAAIAVVLALVYGVVVERFYVLRSGPAVHANVPDLPPAWERGRIACIADIHVGMWLGNTSMARRAVRELIESRPDVILIAGDFVVGARGHEERIHEAMELLRPLAESGIPTFAVLGNHDYGIFSHGYPVDLALADEAAAAASKVGITVLRNESRPVSLRGGPPLYIVGIDSRWAGRDDPEGALAAVPSGSARVVFMHNPASFERIAAGAAPLAIAAHTHGGDVRLPFLPHWSWLDLLPSDDLPTDGWAEPHFGLPGNRLYVNRGIGNSTIPIRINDPPEISNFVLHRSP